MERRDDIDRAKGLAILLVVFGHLVARADPAGVERYEPLRRAVYAIHMPFLLYLSGVVAVHSGMLLAPRAAWPRAERFDAEQLAAVELHFGMRSRTGHAIDWRRRVRLPFLRAYVVVLAGRDRAAD